jgi:hypothetical protein
VSPLRREKIFRAFARTRQRAKKINFLIIALHRSAIHLGTGANNEKENMMKIHPLAALSILALAALTSPAIHLASAATPLTYGSCARSSPALDQGRCANDRWLKPGERHAAARIDDTPERTGPKVEE